MKRRMNLFRQLQEPAPAPSLKHLRPKLPGKPPQLKLGFHTGVGGGVLVLVGIGMLSNYSDHSKKQAEMKARMDRADAQLKTILAESEQLSAELQRIKLAKKRDVAVIAPQAVEASQGVLPGDRTPLDGSWSALLWRLSSVTRLGVQLSNMDLSRGGGGAGGTLVMVGVAESLPHVKAWIERLMLEIPGYDFAIDNQTLSETPKYPVSFRVTARQG